MNSKITYNHIYGCLMGTALGDSMGLPFEGLSRKKIAKKNFDFSTQHLFLSKGMFSDDTEQTILVAQTLIETYDNEKLFEKKMRRGLQKWLLALPAGIGVATLKSIIRSFFIKHPAVFSAGNAPAMRCAILGVLFGNNDTKLQRMVKINTLLTHSDPKAYYGALAVAKASYLSSIGKEGLFFEKMKTLVKDEEFNTLLSLVENNLELSSLEFLIKLDLEKGVGGYIYYTLPMVLHVWLNYKNDFQKAIVEMVKCGGDTDTTGAILGAIIGSNGKKLPQSWIKGIVDYPLSVKVIQEVSLRLERSSSHKSEEKALWLPYPLIFLRNMVFLIIVLVVFVVRGV